MTLEDISNVKTYTGNGVSSSFSTVFSFYESDHIIVTIDGVTQVEDTDYTVTGGDGSTGTVTFTTPPALDEAIVLERAVPYEQQTDFADFDGDPSDVTEKQFDLLVMQTQQLRDLAERTITIPAGTAGFNSEMDITGNGGKYVQLNDDLTGFTFSEVVTAGELTVSAFAETLLDDTTAATMRTTLGLGTIAVEDVTFTASKYGAILVQNGSDDGFTFITSQGTSGQVLTSAGADALPTWSSLSGNAIKISSQSISGASEVDFTGLSSTYKRYYIVGYNLTFSSDASTHVFLASTDNGSTFLGGTNYAYQTIKTVSGTQDLGTNSSGTSSMVILTTPGNAANESGMVIIEIENPASSSHYKMVRSHATYLNHTPRVQRDTTDGYVATTTAINAARLSFTGTCTGTFELWGM